MKNLALPVAVDLDGTLIKTDLLVESFLHLIKINPLYLVLVFVWLVKGKAVLKREIARRVELDVTVLPYHDPLLNYLREQKSQGRTIVLTTASHRKYAEQISAHLGLFDKVYATENKNFSAQDKAVVLCNDFGEKQFVYAGGDKADLPVWEKSSHCIVVTHSDQLARNAERLAPLEKLFKDPYPSLKLYIRACRLHQWVKNALIFIPLIAAHKVLEVELVLNSFLAFLAFSLCASSVYLLNDLLDLEADRHHQKKRARPFAAGTIPALQGIFLIPVLLLMAVAIASMLPMAFSFVLMVYYLATTAYSFALKRHIMLDVMVLSGLYTVRIVAGSAATGIELSQWLLAFSMFIFLSLALVKRYTELMDLQARGEKLEAKGRGYAVDDIELLASLGGASGYLSVLVLALYINTDFVQSMYPSAQILWAICPLMLYWISRVWIIAHRGRMDDDPIVFAVKDPVSRYTVLAIGAIFVWASW